MNITRQAFDFIQPATPPAAAEQDTPEGSAHPDLSIASGPVPVAKSGSFHFLQESEIEPTSLEQSVEWVEHPTAAEMQQEDASASGQVNGHGTENVQAGVSYTSKRQS
jgi:hypothetical protein